MHKIFQTRLRVGGERHSLSEIVGTGIPRILFKCGTEFFQKQLCDGFRLAFLRKFLYVDGIVGIRDPPGVSGVGAVLREIIHLICCRDLRGSGKGSGVFVDVHLREGIACFHGMDGAVGKARLNGAILEASRIDMIHVYGAVRCDPPDQSAGIRSGKVAVCVAAFQRNGKCFVRSVCTHIADQSAGFSVGAGRIDHGGCMRMVDGKLRRSAGSRIGLVIAKLPDQSAGIGLPGHPDSGHVGIITGLGIAALLHDPIGIGILVFRIIFVRHIEGAVFDRKGLSVFERGAGDEAACDAVPGNPRIRQGHISDLISGKLSKHPCLADGLSRGRSDHDPVDGIRR